MKYTQPVLLFLLVPELIGQSHLWSCESTKCCVSFQHSVWTSFLMRPTIAESSTSADGWLGCRRSLHLRNRDRNGAITFLCGQPCLRHNPGSSHTGVNLSSNPQSTACEVVSNTSVPILSLKISGWIVLERLLTNQGTQSLGLPPP